MRAEVEVSCGATDAAIDDGDIGAGVLPLRAVIACNSDLFIAQRVIVWVCRRARGVEDDMRDRTNGVAGRGGDATGAEAGRIVCQIAGEGSFI